MDEDFPTTEAFDDIDDLKKNKKKDKKKKSGGFQSMGLSAPVLKGILAKGYKVPTPIQRKVTPIILQGTDVVAMARTGSGKTAAFLIPLFERLKCHSAKVGARALILSPTRELATQTMKFAIDIGRYTDLRACCIVGGDSMDSQFSDLARNPDIIVATPGRLLHHLIEVDMSLSLVEYVVFDEADRLFELGFSEQLTQILERVASNRQTVLMSATMPKVLVNFANAGLHNPTLIRLDTESKLSENLNLAFFTCRTQEKIGALVYLLSTFIESDKLTIVFAATKHHVEFLQEILKIAGVHCCAIYGSMDQTARTLNLNRFRKGYPSVLIVTDVAARGIDVPLLDNVINFDFPGKPKLFIHRAGRAARAGRIGTCVSLVSPEELPHMIDLHLFLGYKLTSVGTTNSFGRIPQLILDHQSDNVARIIESSSDLLALQKVANNAFKLYFRSRASPSPESVVRAKDISITQVPVHPLLVYEVNQNEQERFDMVESLKTFRPNQTIMEIRHKNRLVPATGRSMPGTEGLGENAVEIMKKKNYIHGGLIAKFQEKKQATVGAKRTREELEIELNEGPAKKQKQDSFKDEEFFMSHFKGDEASERGLGLDDFQKSAADAMLDLMPDERDKILKKEQSMKWDRKKKKFVGVSGQSKDQFGKLKRLNESGARVDSKGKKLNLYKDWQKKSKMSIQKAGEDEVGNQSSKDASLANLRSARRFRHTKDSSDMNVKSELKSADKIAKERKDKEKRLERNQKGGKPNRHHPKKTQKMQNKRSTNTRSKVIVH